ncbi:MAG TPA: hypothetical protein ENK02_04360 [Planctomycetes bacterium]|nr:hypothetical protein [Planctomycetota bacterium]
MAPTAQTAESGYKARDKAWGDSLVLGLLFLALYLSLRQETFYLFDGHNMALRLARFSPASILHPFPDILAQWLSRLLAPLGLRPFAILGGMSGIGMAAAVLLSHRFFLSLGLDRWRASLCALLVGGTPNVLFFATVIEVHGVFLPFAVLGLWAATWAAREGGGARFLLAALACGFASFAHSSMHILMPFYLLWMDAWARERDLADGRRDGKRRLGRAILFGIAYGGAAALTRWGFRLLDLLPATPPASHPLSTGVGFVGFVKGLPTGLYWAMEPFLRRKPEDIPYLFLTPVKEWILPSFPVSLAFLFAWREKADRPLLRSLLVGLGLVTLVTFLLLGSFVEYGAYFLPFVIPAAYLGGKSLSKRTLGILVVLGLVGGISWVKVHDKRPFQTQANSLGALEAQEGPLLVLAEWLPDPVFLGGIHAFRKSQIWFLRELGLDALPPDQALALVQRFRTQTKGEASPPPILLSEGGLRWLKAKGAHPSRAFFLKGLRLGFDWVEVHNGFLLRPKGR